MSAPVEQGQAGSRRIVTRVGADGKSGVHPDSAAPRVDYFKAIPGMRSSILWSTEGEPVVPGQTDPVPSLGSLHPAPGGSVFMTLTVPPDSTFASPSFDPVAAAQEHARLAPGLAERVEPNVPGFFHTTDTLDYVVVLEGEIWLVTDEGEVRLEPGDTVVQHGTRHAWHNHGEVPATIAVVLLGARRSVHP
ncbi:cupin domain-containing protein [Burkholderia multivorans]|uniref:cupin domain-containing protein n=1 Tax=Burkholderia multivorans TaxID=87883 RepID=UPI001C23797B|nr:cupin domain-containing protein [Burkholderia multivorans]MBU9301210.1 cupin domain-containing protein [Burkholderia multivorans]HEM7850543.1 cupin domain-containing protein [Burkholderia multivorans]